MQGTGQDIFNPPNIAGWPTGKEWLSGQLLEKRIKYTVKQMCICAWVMKN